MAMRAITSAILISILTGATAAAQSMNPPPQSAPARQERPATNGIGTVPQAPIGHRQPTLGDLPSSVRKEEDAAGSRRRTPNPFGDVPNICNGC